MVAFLIWVQKVMGSSPIIPKTKNFRGVGGMVRRVCFENKYNCEVIVGSSPTLPKEYNEL
jgi:hypothetical protein